MCGFGIELNLPSFFKNTRGNSIHREFQVPSSGSFKLKHNHDNDSIRFDGNPMSLSVYILPRWRCCLSENLKQMSHLAMGENLDINYSAEFFHISISIHPSICGG